MDLFKFVVEGVMILVVGLIGICGNIAAIIVFGKRQRHQRNFHAFMLCLSIAELLCLIAFLLLFTLPHLSDGYKTSGAYYILTPWLIPFAQIGIAGSIYFTMAITVERYLTVCHPFYMFSRSAKTEIVIAVITVFIVVYNIPKFFEFSMAYRESSVTQSGNGSEERWKRNTTNTTDDGHICDFEWVLHSTKDYSVRKSHHIQNCTTPNTTETALPNTSPIYQYEFVPSELRQNPYYFQFYAVYANVVVNGVIPFALLIVLNLLIIRGLRNIKSATQDAAVPKKSLTHAFQTNGNRGRLSRRQSQGMGETAMAKISLIVVFVFICCHSVKWIPNIHEIIMILSKVSIAEEEYWPPWVDRVTCISHFLLTFNCSANFWIYYIKRKMSQRKGRGSDTTMTVETRLRSRNISAQS